MTNTKQGVLLFFAGLFLIFSFSFWRFYRARILSFSQAYPEQKQEETKVETSRPTFIEIPSVGIKLPVEESSIIDGVWQISFKGASHLDKSARPGENGNVVIYGHNKNEIFGAIRWLKEGDTIKVKNEEGKEYMYRIVKTLITNPNDIQYVLPKDKETLTLYTCTGFLDSKRYIVIAESAPVEEKP